MGCDIHLFVEYKDKAGKWHRARPRITAEWAVQANAEAKAKAKPGEKPYLYAEKVWYDNRNYDLFAMLADVRNDGFNPISAPKGLPRNVSPSVKKESDGWDCDGHSHSWLTLAELEAYDWDQKAIMQGMVSKAQAEEFRKTGKPPESWCGWTNATDVETIRWEIKYRDHVTEFLNVIMPALRKLAAEHGGPKNVRMVFWFDN